MTEFHVLRAERFVITAGTEQERYKLLQILFREKEGGIYVDFPYFEYSQGLLGHYKIAASPDGTSTISLLQGGKTTSQRVKYSYHTDGEAHFSQDAKIRTEVRKKSVPLRQVEGHLFTVHLQGVRNFKPSGHRSNNGKRFTFNLDLEDPFSGGIKVVGSWYAREKAARNNPGGKIIGPYVLWSRPDGPLSRGVLLAPPLNTPMGDYILALTCDPMPLFSTQQAPLLLAIGGFDEGPVASDPNHDTSILALYYTDRASSFDELSLLLGSVDFQRLKDSEST